MCCVLGDVEGSLVLVLAALSSSVPPCVIATVVLSTACPKMPGKRPTVKPFSIKPGSAKPKKTTWTRLEDLAQRDAQHKAVGLLHDDENALRSGGDARVPLRQVVHFLSLYFQAMEEVWRQVLDLYGKVADQSVLRSVLDTCGASTHSSPPLPHLSPSHSVLLQVPIWTRVWV
jgi:hypothetical protein